MLEAKIKDINTSAKEVENGCGIAEKDFIRFTDTLSESLTPAIVLGKEIVQSSGGSYKLMLISAINYLMNARIYLLCERANEQGLA